MKKIFTILAILILFSNQSHAELIGLEKDEKSFGEWRLICENDVMIDVKYCKIASKFYEDQAAISLEPSFKMTNQMIMVIPNLTPREMVKIRIDKQDIIFSSPIKKSDFGLVILNPSQKSIILSQMKKGDFLFIRFNITSSQKDITVKLDLKDFRQAVDYYNSNLS
ncbi:MAG: invasion protein IalB [Rickettsiales bacterium]|jgi:invasion protein IalB